jgi:3,4-dihydroxybenzoyl-citryl-spermidine/N-citryl-spermidine--spermidine ligase
MQKTYPLSSRKVERRVVRQLLEAVIFEGLMDFDESAPRLEEAYSTFYLFGKNRTYRCEGRRCAFDRVRLKEENMYCTDPDQTCKEATIAELAEDLVADPVKRSVLEKELQQTVQLSEWNEAHLPLPPSRRTSSFEELESELWEGHPYHPCFKARTGFSLNDHAAYGPEAKQSFALQWAAVRRECARIALLEDEKGFWERELGPIMLGQLLDELYHLGKTFEEYTFLPIHPWQMKTMKGELKTGDVILLETSGDSYRATQSVRTLWNAGDSGKAYLKLSMNMVNTSSLRTLDVHSICAAPHLSEWISKTAEADPFLKEEASLVVLKEYAGIAFQPAEQESDKNLGAIWRESIRNYMHEEEKAVPFTALPLKERDGRIFIDDWLRHYGIETWLKRLIQVSVVPVWHLLAAHGIAVEAHAQNMILLHKNGWPTRVALRDFHDSTEYAEEFLANPRQVPHFQHIHENFRHATVDKYYWMSSVEALRELVMDTLFVFHLSELSYVLEEQYGYSEKKFWKLIWEALSGHLNTFPELIFRHSRLQSASPCIHAESLLRKKVQEDSGNGFRHTVSNAQALYDYHE